MDEAGEDDIEETEEEKKLNLLKNMLVRWIIYIIFLNILQPILYVIFSLLPFGLENIVVLTIKIYLILPGSSIYLNIYRNLKLMELDSYVDEGFPKYCSIFLKKSIIKTL